MLYAGLRHHETRTLQWTAFDPDWRWLRWTAKGSKPRIAAVNPDLADAARTWRTHSTSASWIFPSPRPWMDAPISSTNFGVHITQIGATANLPDLTPHTLRHTFATRLLEQGNDIALVKDALGHASISTTTVYLRIAPGRLSDALTNLTYRPAT